jgi:DNA polymerase-3 subunit gamma/tau
VEAHARPSEQVSVIEGLPTVENWPSISQQVPAKGLTRQALVQTELLSAKNEGDQLLITLLTGVKAYAEAAMAGRIEAALSEHFGTSVRLTMQTGQVAQTAHAVQSENRKQAMEEARSSIEADPFIGELKALMGATVVQGSQRPLHEQGPADV